MFIGLVAICCLSIPELSASTGWAIGVLMLIETFLYDIMVRPVCVSASPISLSILQKQSLSERLIRRYCSLVFAEPVLIQKLSQYSLVAEMPSTRLRIKTVVLSRTTYNLIGILIGFLQPRFMNPTAWNWGAKTTYFWAGFNLMGLIWTYFRLPEPKGYVISKATLLCIQEFDANFQA